MTWKTKAWQWVTTPWRFAHGLWLALSLDERDAVFFFGLLLMGVGLWWMWPPVSLAVCGLVLVVFAMGVSA